LEAVYIMYSYIFIQLHVYVYIVIYEMIGNTNIENLEYMDH
jgi:hypothetical protein